MILGIRDRVLTTGGVIDLLPEAPSLWSSVQDNIRTTLSFEEIISLARAAEQVADENIRQGQISFSEVYSSTGPNGEEILIPIGTDVRLLVEDLFRAPGTPSRAEQAAQAAQ